VTKKEKNREKWGKSLKDRLRDLRFRNQPIEYTGISHIVGATMEELKNGLARLNLHYRGVIFYSEIGFPRYHADYVKLLKDLGYYPIAQEIDPSIEIHGYMKTRIAEKLAEAVKNEIRGHLAGGANFQIASLDAELSKAVETTFKKPETLINLIETYLQQITNPLLPDEIKKFIKSYSYSCPNLMIVISNAADFTPEKFEPTIRDVFSVSIPSTNQFAGLTLVCRSPWGINELLHSSSWFEYNPKKIVSDSSGKLWSMLGKEVQNCFADQETFRKFLFASEGETGLLREEWKELWDTAKDQGVSILKYR
jgi:hypothetical protein